MSSSWKKVFVDSWKEWSRSTVVDDVGDHCEVMVRNDGIVGVLRHHGEREWNYTWIAPEHVREVAVFLIAAADYLDAEGADDAQAH